jgi:phage anti-repressor protein
MELVQTKMDDRLVEILNENLNSDEQKLFVQSFQAYLQYSDDDTAFVINLDDIWEWVGFSKKDKAKDLLIKHFIENIQYRILLPDLREQNSSDDKRGGHNKENIMLTVNTFKKFCMKASTKRADQVCDYYLKMENIMQKYLKEQLEKFQADRVAIESRNNQLLLRLEAVKEAKKEVDESGFIYILSNIKESERNLYKVGETSNYNNRIIGLNNGSADNNMTYKRTFPTLDRIIAEKLIHTYLIKNKYKYNKEFFNIPLDSLIKIVECFTLIVDNIVTMKFDTFNTKLRDLSSKTHLADQESNIPPDIEKDSSQDLEKHLEDLVEQQASSQPAVCSTQTFNTPNIPNLKYFNINTYVKFAEENLRFKMDSGVTTESMRAAFAAWRQNNDIESLKKCLSPYYEHDTSFVNEFRKAMENVLKIEQKRICRVGKLRGFEHIELISD